MADINLLPIDLSPSRGSAKFANFLKKIIIVLGAVFLITVILGIILIFFISNQVKISDNNIKTLRKNITSLEGTEEKLFLIKDRLGKIKLAESDPNGAVAFSQINQSVSNLPANVSVDSVDINTLKTRFTVKSTDSQGIALFLNSLVISGFYKNLSLVNFTFTLDQGYLLTLQGS